MKYIGIILITALFVFAYFEYKKGIFVDLMLLVWYFYAWIKREKEEKIKNNINNYGNSNRSDIN